MCAVNNVVSDNFLNKRLADVAPEGDKTKPASPDETEPASPDETKPASPDNGD